jgi:hypothetical protein
MRNWVDLRQLSIVLVLFVFSILISSCLSLRTLWAPWAQDPAPRPTDGSTDGSHERIGRTDAQIGWTDQTDGSDGQVGQVGQVGWSDRTDGSEGRIGRTDRSDGRIGRPDRTAVSAGWIGQTDRTDWILRSKSLRQTVVMTLLLNVPDLKLRDN